MGGQDLVENGKLYETSYILLWGLKFSVQTSWELGVRTHKLYE